MELGRPEPKELRGRHPEGESQHRQKIAGRPEPVPIEKTLAEQNNVARLGVGEDPAPAEVGVGVLKPAGESEEGNRKQALSGGVCRMVHLNQILN